MSYALNTKTFPNLIKSFPQKLFLQPTSIAVMASLGIHGLLGVSLPYLPIASQEKPKPLQNVKLVQLTPTEQSRLPQLSPPPPLPNQFQSLYPLPSSLSTPLPSLSKDSSVFNLPPIGSLPPASSALSSSYPSQSIKKLPQSFKPQQQTRKNPTVGAEPVIVGPIGLGSSILSRPELRNLVSGVTPAPVRAPFSSNANGGTGQGQVQVGSSNQTSLGSTGSSGGITPAPNQPVNPVIARVEQSRQRNWTYNSSGTSDRDFKERGGAYLIAATSRTKTPAKQLQMDGFYPIGACYEKLKGSSIVGVLVDKGSIDSNSLQIVQSSGYQAFDRIALSTVRSHKFEATDKVQPYMVKVKFEYDSKICGSSTAPQAPSDRQTQSDRPSSTERSGSGNRPSTAQPQGTPQPSNTAQPQGTPQPSNTAQPQGTPQPSNTAQPQGTPQPSNTAQPQGTPQPSNAAQPQGTPQPSNAAQPQGTPQPGGSP